MRVKHFIPDDFEEGFGKINIGIDFDKVKDPKCIAYENLGGDDYRIVYEVYVDNLPRFFCFSNVEAPRNPEDELAAIKKWAQTDRARLIENSQDQFSFELSEPFGIYFTRM